MKRVVEAHETRHVVLLVKETVQSPHRPYAASTNTFLMTKMVDHLRSMPVLSAYAALGLQPIHVFSDTE